MDRENRFVTKQHIIEAFNKSSKEKVEKEVVIGLQAFAEKFLTDLLHRTALFTKHRESNLITSEDILFTVEKEFDYCFGQRVIKNTKPVAADEHVARLAEISRHKQ